MDESTTSHITEYKAYKPIIKYLFFVTAMLDVMCAMAIIVVVSILPLDDMDSKVCISLGSVGVIGLNVIHMFISSSEHGFRNMSIVSICNIIVILIFISSSIVISDDTGNPFSLQVYSTYIIVQLGWSIIRVCLFFMHYYSKHS